jgi:hypothetical protein
MLLLWSFCSAKRNSLLSSARKLRRVQPVASSGRFRHTNTTEDASAFDPLARALPIISVRIGHVPVIAKPARIREESIVSQPVEEVASSFVSL